LHVGVFLRGSAAEENIEIASFHHSSQKSLSLISVVSVERGEVFRCGYAALFSSARKSSVSRFHDRRHDNACIQIAPYTWQYKLDEFL
jgi:hypothetical protein